MGYLKKRSLPSLIAGCTFSALYGISAQRIKYNQSFGIELATATSAVLLAAMLPRALKTKKKAPAILSLVGLSGLGYYSLKLYQQTNGI
jgi:uncharacterized membrane protein (UPF0136 family)